MGSFKKLIRYSTLFLDLRDLVNLLIERPASIVFGRISPLMGNPTALLLSLLCGADNRLNRLLHSCICMYMFLLMSNLAARFLLLSIVSNRIN